MRSLKDVAEELASAHRAADPATMTIKLFRSPNGEEVRLLEISSTAPTTGEVMPFRFAADSLHQIDYPSVVILLSPAEWNDVLSGGLPLPTGWDLSSAENLLDASQPSRLI